MAKLDKSLYSKEEYRRLKKELKKNNSAQIDPVEIPIEQNSAKTAYVIGNGMSRKDIDINTLSKYGKVYGCNALYRVYEPDYLIAVDVKMILEINASGYQRHNAVYTNYNKAYENLKNFNYFKPSKGWSSGPTALWFATQHGYSTIYILGFDFKGLVDGTKFNNIYADTNNYKKSTDGATFHGNWLRQTKLVLEDNPKIQFIRVVDHDTYLPDEFKKQKNLKTMNKNAFIDLHKNI